MQNAVGSNGDGALCYCIVPVKLMSASIPSIDRLKEQMKTTWMAGDFGQIAKYTEAEAESFIERLDIRSGMKVLDVACGTGNLSLPAARKGAQVVGVDIATNLLEQARARASAEELPAEFRLGDAEQLPFQNEQFDLIVSMFGAMFAPRPELVASELVRVCCPGGLVAMANWTPEGFVGKSFALTSRHVPPPEGIEPPVLWGKEEVVEERFAQVGWKVDTTRRDAEIKYPFGGAAVVQFFRQYFGPTQAAFSRLDEAGQSALAADLEKLWVEHNQGPANQTHVKAEYLEVRASKA